MSDAELEMRLEKLQRELLQKDAVEGELVTENAEPALMPDDSED